MKKNNVEEVFNYASDADDFKNKSTLEETESNRFENFEVINLQDEAVGEAASENVEHNDDFSYSQKLFHIADGNLYSIFSPLQGRSYGVKPSFLRKQKCTVQECHSRGRKNLNKGLKFHNFLPSESVISEKDDNFFEDKWKIHSECKLREEHGTKQIMVANWSQCIKTFKNPDLKYCPVKFNDLSVSANTVNKKEVENQTENNSLCTLFNVNYNIKNDSHPVNFGNSKLIESLTSSKTPSAAFKYSSTKKSDVKLSVLNRLLQKAESSNIKNSEQNFRSRVSSSDENSKTSGINSKKCRRKPNHTRRIVPYTKYLSLLEENKFPLDLSLRTIPPENEQLEEFNYTQTKNVKNLCNSVSEINHKDKMFNSTTDVSYKFMNVNDSDYIFNSQPVSVSSDIECMSFGQNHSVAPPYFFSMPINSPNYLQEVVTSNKDLYKVLKDSAKNIALKQKVFKPSNILFSVTNKQNSDNSKERGILNSKSEDSVLKSFSEFKPKKRNQRSVIKKKLEDTFRKNGFLIKTKQVSDGDATFCKFRQLRKYTRYYLKSWHHHLPDEVHKMWKGFLPPKTVIPSVSVSLLDNEL